MRKMIVLPILLISTLSVLGLTQAEESQPVLEKEVMQTSSETMNQKLDVLFDLKPNNENKNGLILFDICQADPAQAQIQISQKIQSLQDKASDLDRTVIKNASVQCIDYMKDFTKFDRLAAAKICKGGVSVECIDYMKDYLEKDRIKAANVCQGGVQVSCVDYMRGFVGQNVVLAAQLCSGGVDLNCIEYMKDYPGLDRTKAANLCKGGVDIKCVDYMKDYTGQNRLKAIEHCK